MFQLASVASQCRRRKLNLNRESPTIPRIEGVTAMAIQMKFIAPLLAAGAGARLPVARQRSVQRTFATRPISPLRQSGLSPLPPLVGVACTGITFTTSDLQRKRY